MQGIRAGGLPVAHNVNLVRLRFKPPDDVEVGEPTGEDAVVIAYRLAGGGAQQRPPGVEAAGGVYGNVGGTGGAGQFQCFTYVSSSLPDSQVSVTGREVRFTLLGDTSFTYTVTASSVEGIGTRGKDSRYSPGITSAA